MKTCVYIYYIVTDFFEPQPPRNCFSVLLRLCSGKGWRNRQNKKSKGIEVAENVESKPTLL